jgi:mannitol-1-phosphate 5-dehydrogenase
VGRQPLRKLSRHERFIGPAAEAVERGLSADALLVAVAAALAFDDPADEQSVQLQQRLRTEDAEALASDVTGLDAGHPLFPAVLEAFAARTVAVRRH